MTRRYVLTEVLSNPNNPTGAILSKTLLQSIIDVAREHQITILSDEVYRPIFHSIGPMDQEFPPSILSMGYENTIATGSLSKAYSLAGIRIGWVASRRRDLIGLFHRARDYNTISVSQVDDQIAAFALSQDTIHSLLARNIGLAKANLAAVEKFMIKYDEECEWVRPIAGTTAFIKFHRSGAPVDARDFCEKLQEKTGVMLVPGDECFGAEFKGYVRLGFVQEEETMQEGLKWLGQFLKKDFDDVKLS
jgi:aspartate/methionine/tyrosine aminotransferase